MTNPTNSDHLTADDDINPKHLNAMMLIARMKEVADRNGDGFIGGFITPSGKRFVVSNIEEDDIQYKHVNNQLNVLQTEVLKRNTKAEMDIEMQQILEAFED